MSGGLFLFPCTFCHILRLSTLKVEYYFAPLPIFCTGRVTASSGDNPILFILW
ncbi:hypothetical protein EMIT0210MI2_250133 [Priestia megaterium]